MNKAVVIIIFVLVGIIVYEVLQRAIDSWKKKQAEKEIAVIDEHIGNVPNSMEKEFNRYSGSLMVISKSKVRVALFYAFRIGYCAGKGGDDHE